VLAVTHRWGAYYTQRARDVIAGNWKTGNVWGGVKEGMIQVGDFGSKVPAAVQAEVLARQKEIGSGKLRPFFAKSAVFDNEGQEVIAKGTALSDAQILGMNWLVQGVVGKLSR
jgi:simple sugar transport system substrate-binding protein